MLGLGSLGHQLPWTSMAHVSCDNYFGPKIESLCWYKLNLIKFLMLGGQFLYHNYTHSPDN